MAYTFPLALNQFFEGLPIETVDFDLPEALQTSETGGGEILSADLGDRLWRADITLPWRYYGDMEAIKAKLHVLRYAGRSLFVHAMPVAAPQADPFGVILGSRAVTLNAVQGNNRELRLAGLPANYFLTPGDCLSFQYGSNLYDMQCIKSFRGGAATSNGVSALLEVVPFIQPGWSLGAAVRLIKPMFKAVIVPGSFKPGTSGGQVTNGAAFSVIQSFR